MDTLLVPSLHVRAAHLFDVRPRDVLMDQVT